MSELKLAYGLTFEELYQREGLLKLDAAFGVFLRECDAGIAEASAAARANPDALTGKEEADLLMALAPHVEDFIGALFGIGNEIRSLAEAHHKLAPLYACKRLFVQRRAMKKYKADTVQALDAAVLRQQIEREMGEPFSELAFATHVMRWLEEEEANADALDTAMQYAAWATHTHSHPEGVIFTTPEKLDFAHLVHLPHHIRHREGFQLTDEGADLTQALDEAHYCIFCHHQGRDSCSKGMKDKEGQFKQTPLGVPLNGCPLEERISEMHELKANGVPLGALAVAVVDNPMVAGTGHRICNDCMKSCIYQKQEPVDIPQAETRTLKDVLNLPWGFEIYSLLTRWNPLNLRRPLPKPETGKKVLVVGLGPAGYTLSHHLMNDGHTVVAVDGLKIEPLLEGLAGKGFQPVERVESLREALDERVAEGFGGVAEYGITVRWDKNYLKIIRLLLQRRNQFALFGGVRFGGTVTVEQAWELGFDHIALCAGAGRPRVLDIPGGMARGVRTASDFLMALQLTGAARRDSIANLQLRLPVVVIGGGLTAIDTATEALAYYPVQVEKFLSRYEALGEPDGLWDAEEQMIADEFISHAKAFRQERQQALHEARAPDFVGLVQKWGGVKMVYRRRLMDSPSYRLNHEEVQKALEEGIEIIENLSPEAVEVDAYGHAETIHFAEGQALPARSVLVAAGTHPNTVLAREDSHHFELDGRFFNAVDENGGKVSPESTAKPASPQVLLSVDAQGRGISFFGDLHPSYAGNVVKAMGSAKQGYPVVSRILAGQAASANASTGEFLAYMQELFTAHVEKVNRLTPTIVEVIIKAPLAARNFCPGQFYRLQNFEANSVKCPGATLAMEGLAMTGAWVDEQAGVISVIALEMGGSSDLCALLKPGEPVVLMGPTGTPTEIPQDETVVLVGGGLGNAVLFSIGKAMREAGNKVLYFAGYKKAQDRYKEEEIEAASDVVVWCCDEAVDFAPSRPQDKVFHGNIVQAIEAYGAGKLGDVPIPLSEAARMVVIGSDKMMEAVKTARHNVLAGFLKAGHQAIGSINSPMQCMMKEICAQCLQQHIDPQTGKITYVYSCFNQDQALDLVSFPHLSERLRQNSTQEKLTRVWIDHCLKTSGLRKAVA